MDQHYQVISIIMFWAAVFLIISMKNKSVRPVNNLSNEPIKPITRKAVVGENVVCIKVDPRPYTRSKYEVGDIGVVQVSEEKFIVVLGWQDTLEHDCYVIINKDWTSDENSKIDDKGEF